MAAVAVDAVPATQGSSATAAVAVVTASALAGVSAVVCISVSVPGLLGYYSTFAFYLATFARGVWPDRVDAVLGPLGAYVRQKALLARADLRLLRAHPATAPVCAGAEECARRARAAVAGWADGARRRVEAKWREHKDAAGAALFVLRLVGCLVRLAATALLDAACEQAKTKAPSVLGYLRSVIHGIRSPTSSCKKGDEAEAEEEDEDAGFVFRDVVCLIGIPFYLLFSIQLIKRSINIITGMQFYGACLATTCGLAVLVADWIDPPDDDDSDEADTTGDSPDDAADTATPEEAKLHAELEVRGSWQFMRVLIFIAFCADAYLLHVTFGPQPLALALLAVCNLEVLNLGREVQLTPDDDGEGAEGPAEGVGGAVDEWRCGAVTVFAASSVKVLIIYLVLDFFMAALSFLWVCAMADLLLAEEESLLELLDASGDDEDREENAGSGEGIGGVVEEGADEARAEEHTDTSSSEDEEEDYTLQEHCDSSEVHSNTTSLEDEEEDALEKQHCDSSEEHDEHLKEQREEEPDCSGGGSMDDGWDLVEVDPEMPVKDETGVNRKSFRLFPWK
ncbi:hypothetical protein SETIT_7G167100v2 [Setaria italica]|uniref:Uncharacterized protein n=1 Tax=Setaria italica TaxID=4555 RepID=K3YDR4_SETIT|nr:uncharacterized protein LOC101777119 [Setaria italica]RCV34538.1 hypothetical protein SETIT_7G167100v2 [Setaria italica]